MPLTIAQSTGGVTSSLDAGAITSGAANQVVTDSGALGAGNLEGISYKVTSNSYQTGTQDNNNANLLVNIGGTNTAGIISAGVTIGKLQSGPVFSSQVFRVNVANGQHVYICIGNTSPGASSVYNASMSITRLPDKYAIV